MVPPPNSSSDAASAFREIYAAIVASIDEGGTLPKQEVARRSWDIAVEAGVVSRPVADCYYYRYHVGPEILTHQKEELLAAFQNSREELHQTSSAPTAKYREEYSNSHGQNAPPQSLMPSDINKQVGEVQKTAQEKDENIDIIDGFNTNSRQRDASQDGEGWTMVPSSSTSTTRGRPTLTRTQQPEVKHPANPTTGRRSPRISNRVTLEGSWETVPPTNDRDEDSEPESELDLDLDLDPDSDWDLLPAVRGPSHTSAHDPDEHASPRLSLRGGCFSDPSIKRGRLEDDEEVPPVVYWLAGGMPKRPKKSRARASSSSDPGTATEGTEAGEAGEGEGEGQGEGEEEPDPRRRWPTGAELRRWKAASRGNWGSNGRPFAKELGFVLSRGKAFRNRRPAPSSSPARDVSNERDRTGHGSGPGSEGHNGRDDNDSASASASVGF